MPAKAERRAAMMGASAVSISFRSTTQALPFGIEETWSAERDEGVALADAVPGADGFAVARRAVLHQAKADPASGEGRPGRGGDVAEIVFHRRGRADIEEMRA